MLELPQEYKRLIALGINSSANLPDLNDMTGRGVNTIKPFTASKTIGVMNLIKEYDISDEKTLAEKFQKFSKKSMEVLTDEIYEHQIIYFKTYKYDKAVIFKYVYCCVVTNSLKGNLTENKFDLWAENKGVLIRKPKAILDEKYHTDRIEIDKSGNSIAFISIKPESFANNFMQYKDVFAGLQFMSNRFKRQWKIYYMDGNHFNLINFQSLSANNQEKVKKWAEEYGG